MEGCSVSSILGTTMWMLSCNSDVGVDQREGLAAVGEESIDRVLGLDSHSLGYPKRVVDGASKLS